jgi:hypothetical protein
MSEANVTAKALSERSSLLSNPNTNTAIRTRKEATTATNNTNKRNMLYPVF